MGGNGGRELLNSEVITEAIRRFTPQGAGIKEAGYRRSFRKEGAYGRPAPNTSLLSGVTSAIPFCDLEINTPRMNSMLDMSRASSPAY